MLAKQRKISSSALRIQSMHTMQCILNNFEHKIACFRTQDSSLYKPIKRWLYKTCRGGEGCCTRDQPCGEVVWVELMIIQTMNDMHLLSLLSREPGQTRHHSFVYQGGGDCDRDDQCTDGLICYPKR